MIKQALWLFGGIEAIAHFVGGRRREPCGRCGFITIAQEGLPQDVEILRTVVKRHERNIGIYCDVVTPGEIAAGATVAVG